jgi:PHD/YefM family antitoxin component YafN of YafNO toxin-antitoxin module
MKISRNQEALKPNKNQFNSPSETEYLLSNPINAKRLMKGIKQANSVKNPHKRKSIK